MVFYAVEVDYEKRFFEVKAKFCFLSMSVTKYQIYRKEKKL